jgi:tight adherence protein C
MTAESIDGILSEELLKALVVTELGTSNWQDSLYDIAQKYEIDSFSDFVLDIVTAFQKGSDITESVERQSRNIKSSTLLGAKEQAAKVTSLILIPVVVFKMIPLMIILFLPVILQILNGM